MQISSSSLFGPSNLEWSTPSRVLKTHPARLSIASVDPPSKFPSLNLPLIKCRSLIHYVYVAYLWNRFDKCGNRSLQATTLLFCF